MYGGPRSPMAARVRSGGFGRRVASAPGYFFCRRTGAGGEGAGRLFVPRGWVRAPAFVLERDSALALAPDSG